LKAITIIEKGRDLLKPFLIPNSVKVVKIINRSMFVLKPNILPESLVKLKITCESSFTCEPSFTFCTLPSSLQELVLEGYDKVIKKTDLPESLLKLKLKAYHKNIDVNVIPTLVKVIKIPHDLKFVGRKGLLVIHYD
jgi:hypothetical protein